MPRPWAQTTNFCYCFELDGFSNLSVFCVPPLFFSAICDSEPEQPVRNCPLWVRVEGEIDPEPIYIPTPSVIEPIKPVVLSNPEVLPSPGHRASNGVKPGRVYTPKPNPVVREERLFLVLNIKTVPKASVLGHLIWSLSWRIKVDCP